MRPPPRPGEEEGGLAPAALDGWLRSFACRQDSGGGTRRLILRALRAMRAQNQQGREIKKNQKIAFHPRQHWPKCHILS